MPGQTLNAHRQSTAALPRLVRATLVTIAAAAIGTGSLLVAPLEAQAADRHGAERVTQSVPSYAKHCQARKTDRGVARCVRRTERRIERRERRAARIEARVALYVAKYGPAYATCARKADPIARNYCRDILQLRERYDRPDAYVILFPGKAWRCASTVTVAYGQAPRTHWTAIREAVARMDAATPVRLVATSTAEGVVTITTGEDKMMDGAEAKALPVDDVNGVRGGDGLFDRGTLWLSSTFRTADDEHAQRRAIYMHELGHLLNLDHIANPTQIMNAMSGNLFTELGRGDRAGLREVGCR